MSWIKIIDYEKADAKLKRIYDDVKGPDNYIDNVLLVHSLRPHTLKGHMELYKNVLHHSGNALPKWYLEAIGVYVSHLNDCAYCVKHHYIGLSRLLDDKEKAEKCRDSIVADNPEKYFSDRYLIGCKYAEILTRNQSSLERKHIEELRDAGFTDGEILELNQVVGYFNYANRTVLGLGVSIEEHI